MTELVAKKVGFTGTRKGMTPSQKEAVVHLVLALAPIEAHIGDCTGADTDFYHIIRQYAPNCKIHGHIPDKDELRSHLAYDVSHAPKPYLERNHAIVDRVAILIASPGESKEIMRSGTWATIRYARKRGVRTEIIYP